MRDIKLYIGNRIRELRKEKGLSQEDLGWKAGLHYTYIGAIERGEKNSSIETLEKISKALKIEIREFFPKGSDISTKDLKSIINKHVDKLSPSILKPISDLVLEISELEYKKTKKKYIERK